MDISTVSCSRQHLASKKNGSSSGKTPVGQLAIPAALWATRLPRVGMAAFSWIPGWAPASICSGWKEETTPKATLVLCRNGDSESNMANMFTGWVDVDLSEKGLNEAKGVGELLKAEGLKIDVAFTSYLKRAIKTCDLTGLDKEETVVKHGEEKVQIWRRSFDIRFQVWQKRHLLSILLREGVPQDEQSEVADLDWAFLLQTRLRRSVASEGPDTQHEIDPLSEICRAICPLSCRVQLMTTVSWTKAVVMFHRMPTHVSHLCINTMGSRSRLRHCRDSLNTLRPEVWRG